MQSLARRLDWRWLVGGGMGLVSGVCLFLGNVYPKETAVDISLDTGLNNYAVAQLLIDCASVTAVAVIGILVTVVILHFARRGKPTVTFGYYQDKFGVHFTNRTARQEARIVLEGFATSRVRDYLVVGIVFFTVGVSLIGVSFAFAYMVTYGKYSALALFVTGVLVIDLSVLSFLKGLKALSSIDSESPVLSRESSRDTAYFVPRILAR